jgi:stearoyl-CoA desaturase (delta-9 desaturase)
MKTVNKSTVVIDEKVDDKLIVMTPDTSCDNESTSNSSGVTAGSTMFKLKAVNLAAVLIPFIGVVVAVVLLWGTAFNWIYLGIFGLMYFLTSIGITIGYHRLFTHRSFKTYKPVVAILAALGSMAVEGPVLQWVADHRRHHQHSDEDGDPHSPHLHGTGIWHAIQGMWHSHMGWMLRPHLQGSMRYIGDLRKDKLVRRMSKQFPMWVLIGLVIPAVLGGLLTWSWMGILLGFIWGGLVRIFLVHHMTWSINSVCHIWGTTPFDTHDHSRNNVIMGVFAMGEGWHNNHHAFQSSARHGLRWWELDFSYMIIWVMSKIGLAYDIRVPTKDRITTKLKAGRVTSPK